MFIFINMKDPSVKQLLLMVFLGFCKSEPVYDFFSFRTKSKRTRLRKTRSEPEPDRSRAEANSDRTEAEPKRARTEPKPSRSECTQNLKKHPSRSLPFFCGFCVCVANDFASTGKRAQEITPDAP